MMVIIALLVILLGAVGFVAYYAVTMSNATANSDPVKVIESGRLTVEQIETVSLTSPISTNLRKSDGVAAQYIKIDLSIGVNNTDKKESPRIVDSLAKNEMVTRDIVLSILRSQTYNELSVPEGQELLKDNIKRRLQEEYDTNLIVQVYISDIAFS
jgi:flagellar basal body-associated protein FliL